MFPPVFNFEEVSEIESAAAAQFVVHATRFMHGQFYAHPVKLQPPIAKPCICLHQEQSIDHEQRKHSAPIRKIDIEEDSI
jgi:hypothetical protein